MRTRQDSLLLRGVLALCTLSLVSVVLVGAVTFVASGSLMERAILYQLELVSDARENEVRRWIAAQESAVVLITQDPRVGRWGEMVVQGDARQTDIDDARDKLSEYLVAVVHTHPGLLSVSLLGASDGRVIVSTSADGVGVLEEGEAYLEQGRQRPYVGQARVPSGADRLEVKIAAPVEIDQAGTVGVVVARFDASWMHAEPLGELALGPDWTEYLVDSDLRVISPDGSGEVVGSESWSDTAASPEDSGPITARTYRGQMGDLVLGAYQRLSGLEVGLVHEVAQSRVVLRPAAKAAAIVAGAALLAATLLVLALLRLGRPTAGRLDLLQSHLSMATQGDLERILHVTGHDELSALGRAFNHLMGRLRDLNVELGGSAADRSESFRQRSLQLRAARQVSSAVSSIAELPELLDATAMLIADSLGFDHVGVFLLDEVDRYVVLKAASSTGGQQMLAGGYRVELGQGPVGEVALTGESRVLDSSEDPTLAVRSALAAARSELVLPLAARGAVIGVLDIVSGRAGAFAAQNADALRGVADQIALAVENVRLRQEYQKVEQELERRYGETAIESWSLRAEAQPLAYRYTGMELVPTETSSEPVPDSRAEIVEPGDGRRALHAPIKIRDQVLGTVVFHQPVEETPWSDEDIVFVESVCRQIGEALESARLLDEARVRASFEVLGGGIRERIRESATDVDRVLQTTLRELGMALGARGTVQLLAREHWRAGSQAMDAAPQTAAPRTAEIGDTTESVDVVH